MRKSVVYNSSITVIRQVLGIIIGMFAAMIIARTLGVDGQGKYALIILLPNIYLINDLLGEPANFWYLQAKPDGASLMDMFPDPPHSLFFTVPLAIAVFYLIYLPYFIKDTVSK